MSRQRVLLLALTMHGIRGVSAKPLNSKEIHELIASGDYENILDGNDISTSPTVSKIGLSRVVELLTLEAQATLVIDSWSHKGIWCATIFDDLADSQLMQILGENCPVVLYGVGEKSLLREPAFGVVGSRNLTEAGAEVAKAAGALSASKAHVLVSGGARGADLIAMSGALENGGRSLGFLANGLTQSSRDPQTISYVHEEVLTLVSPYSPDAPFSVGAAMGRNKLIYGASDSVFVVASDKEKGGTWAGAVEAIKKSYTSVNVWLGAGSGPGNAALVKLGATGVTQLNDAFKKNQDNHAQLPRVTAEQMNLF